MVVKYHLTQTLAGQYSFTRLCDSTFRLCKADSDKLGPHRLKPLDCA